MADVLDVWLDGRFAGQLMRGQTEQVEFLYSEDYAAGLTSTPLSLSMPTSVLGHGPEVVMPWLSNLLPDAEEVRNRWAAKFGTRRTDPFTLLTHMGEDAPGSVQVTPENAVPSEASALSPITESEIARRVQSILEDPDHWVDDTDESRFSLGGNQGKFALAQINGEWFEPNGRAASTHIVKPGMVLAAGRTDAHVQAVEFVTMRTARRLGIRAANVELHEFGGIPTFVTTRFDRRNTVDGGASRVHQEDFCQALSIYPSRKYEQDGGPTMADMMGLLARSSSPAYRMADKIAFAELLAFNLLVAGVDAHAKNHSLLHAGSTTRLAPAYDLISAHGIWPDERVRFAASAAVKYGKERAYRKITSRNLMRTADVIGIPREAFSTMLGTMAEALPEAVQSAVDEVPAGMVTSLVRSLPQRIGSFAADMVTQIDPKDANLRNLPRFKGTRAIGRPAANHLWVPGKWRNGQWNTGHYRERAGR